MVAPSVVAVKDPNDLARMKLLLATAYFSSSTVFSKVIRALGAIMLAPITGKVNNDVIAMLGSGPFSELSIINNKPAVPRKRKPWLE